MDRACSTHGRDEKCIRILVRKPEGKRPLGRTSRRWLNNIRMHFSQVSLEGVEWIHLT
jgi:hypothetical protein